MGWHWTPIPPTQEPRIIELLISPTLDTLSQNTDQENTVVSANPSDPPPTEEDQARTQKALTSRVVTPLISDSQAPQTTSKTALPALNRDKAKDNTPPLLVASTPSENHIALPKVPPKLVPQSRVNISEELVASAPIPAQRPDRNQVDDDTSQIKKLLKSLALRDDNILAGREKKGAIAKPDPKLDPKPDPKAGQGADSNAQPNDVTPAQELQSQKTVSADLEKRPSPQLTQSDVFAIKAQYQRCWRVLALAQTAENIAVKMEITVDDQLNVTRAKIVDRPAKPSLKYQSALVQAMSAVQHPGCRRLPLPPGSLRAGDTLLLNFNPAKLSR